MDVNQERTGTSAIAARRHGDFRPDRREEVIMGQSENEPFRRRDWFETSQAFATGRHPPHPGKIVLEVALRAVSKNSSFSAVAPVAEQFPTDPIEQLGRMPTPFRIEYDEPRAGGDCGIRRKFPPALPISEKPSQAVDQAIHIYWPLSNDFPRT